MVNRKANNWSCLCHMLGKTMHPPEIFTHRQPLVGMCFTHKLNIISMGSIYMWPVIGVMLLNERLANRPEIQQEINVFPLFLLRHHCLFQDASFSFEAIATVAAADMTILVCSLDNCDVMTYTDDGVWTIFVAILLR